MSDNEMLMHAADRIEAWFQHAWPLWIEQGFDRNLGLFDEQLDFNGRPDRSVPRRMRVQGRQLYGFSCALASGHAAALPALEQALPSIESHCWDANGGWIHLLAPDGQPRDRLRDTYDQAFMLFGLCAAHRAGLPQARRLADATFAFIDAEITDQGDGSVREGVPASLPRRSNPHMHLLEAMLAWFRATGEPVFLERANRLASVFRDRFFDPANGTLGEYFTGTLERVAGPDGELVEPGHHFEWSWLLHRLADAGGLDLREQAVALHRWGLAHGLDAGGFAIDECERSGAQRRASRRTWPQTELLKSFIANGAPEQAACVAIALLDTYLATDVAGLWIDQFDAAGQPRSDVVPASTLYHVVVAFEELLQAAGRSMAS